MNPTIDHPTSALRDARAEISATQAHWALIPLRERLRIVRAIRHLIAENADVLAAAAAAVSNRALSEKLVSEVLPLADACRWLERDAARVLAPRRCGRRGRPFWMTGVSFEIQRQPFGTVLVIGPANYPLFLPAVHSLQTLVAGNAVLLKPAPGTRAVALAFARLAIEAGLDPALLTILPETVEAAGNAIAAGVDKVVFTGSSENGREVLALLAGSNTPSVMELSGEDPVIVLADADLDLVVRALRFGTALNAGNTCIAPRHLICVEAVADEMMRRLSLPEPEPDQVATRADSPLHSHAAADPSDLPEGQWKSAGGASHRNPGNTRTRPGGGAGTARADSAVPPGPARFARRVRWLAPPATLVRPSGTHAGPAPDASGAPREHVHIVRDAGAAVDVVNAAEFALGASIFTRDIPKARALASQIKTGFVLINDLIVPTADPRMPFGGVRASGFGTTRGGEGLLEMTHPHVVAIRRGRLHPHFDQPAPDDARLFTAYIRAAHGRSRLAALPALLRALFAKSTPAQS